MTSSLAALILIGALISCGVYMLLERTLTRMLLGLLLISNGVNLLLMTVGGKSGSPPIRGATSADREFTADPLAQAMILTAIVITMGVAAFVLALAYRSFRLTTEEEVAPDPEDVRVSERAEREQVDEDVMHPESPLEPDEREELDALPRDQDA